MHRLANCDCNGSGMTKPRCIGHEGRGARFPCECQHPRFIPVWRVQRVFKKGSYHWTHRRVGGIFADERSSGIVEFARRCFLKLGEDDSSIQVGFFYRAFRSKEVS